MAKGIDSLEPLLVRRFSEFLKAYDRDCPFTKYGQLEHHVAAIGLRRRHKTARAAIEDSEFRAKLYDVLRAWQIGSRGSNLKPFQVFEEALLSRVELFQDFDALTIDADDLEVASLGERLAELAQNLGIVDNDNRVVAGSKALHHMFPDLVVPIDRAYTQRFFGWPTPRFQYDPIGCFTEAFASFARIARAVEPSRYVGSGWYTSRSKVIDNAIVGFWRHARAEIRRYSL